MVDERLTDDAEDALLVKSTREMRFGQFRFVGWVVGICLLLMLLSPVFNRYLEAYEAVVAAPPEGGSVLILTADGMPRTKRISPTLAQDLEAGTYLMKENFAWNPRPVSLDELSRQGSRRAPDRGPALVLPDLYERYSASWDGTIVSVDYRLLPTRVGRAGEQEVEYLMVVEMDDGARREMVIPATVAPPHLPPVASRAVDQLERLLVGRRIEKHSLTWEPTLGASRASELRNEEPNEENGPTFDSPEP